MKRLTKRWGEQPYPNLAGKVVCEYKECDSTRSCEDCIHGRYKDRLAAIEDILGDEYDIERLRNLVEADKLLGKNVYLSRNELLELYTLKDPALNETGVVPLPVIRQNIMDMPAADVVDVVRCRDCVYGFALQSYPGVLYCRVTAETTPPDGFCHNGGRSNAN